VEATGPNCGMDVTFVTTSKDNKAAKELLVALGMPFAGRN
jgi:ribosomal protein L5